MDQIDKFEGVPPHEVIEFFYGRSIDTEISVICRRHRFIVSVSRSDLHDEDGKQQTTFKSDYERLLTAVIDDDPSGIEDLNTEDYHDPTEVMYDWLTTPLFPLFSKLPSIQDPLTRLQTLDEYANPPTAFYKLKVVKGKLIPVSSEDNNLAPTSLLPSVSLPASSVNASLPTFSPQDIQIPWDSLMEGAPFPRIVLLNRNQKFYFRTAHDPEAAKRESDILNRVLTLGLQKKFRLPKLHAYVKYEKEEHIVGYLLEYIDHQHFLDEVIAENASGALRRNWYRTIADTTSALHNAGIVWGDAKADNVLIDNKNHAWVIDFGGGRTEGWVDEDVMETVAGDLQGLSRIKAFLNLR